MTKRWGLLADDNRIHEITDIDPKGRFPDDMRWIEVLEDTKENAVFNPSGGAITNPPPDPEPVPAVVEPVTKLSKLQFFDLFSIDEEAALTDSSDKVIQVGLRRLNAADFVDLADQRTKDFVGYLGVSKALPLDRVKDILAGKPAPAFSISPTAA